MRQHIQWQLPDHAYHAYIMGGRKFLFRMFGRISILSIGAGVITVAVIQYVYPGLQPRVYQKLWKVILIFPAFFTVGYFIQMVIWQAGTIWPQVRTTYAVSSRGVSRSDNTRSWSRYVAFNIEPHPDYPPSNRIVLFRKKGDHDKLTLPGGTKDDLVIRFVAKHLPLVEELPDPEIVNIEQIQPSVWIRWLMCVANGLYGLAFGYCIKGYIAKDLIELMVYTVFFINPATLAALIAKWAGFLRRKRMEVLGWWLVLSLISMLFFLFGMLMAP